MKDFSHISSMNEANKFLAPKGLRIFKKGGEFYADFKIGTPGYDAGDEGTMSPCLDLQDAIGTALHMNTWRGEYLARFGNLKAAYLKAS
ncbi:hypothetical protein FJ955_02015 [Mesorhizobium sp. B2-2-2]|uniref:hypothetical protein n=1 Tax=Mesorhizobium sp. B2-2-2 TaxID=2589964 RepID=UPI001129B3AE|nr:hypothetical protein [Mesorhizobium sp. B2-2-2]TPM33547.1 hypothetical protein FJ955_02015 [Mesorhizobium sp. B2-2-2]